MEGVQEAIHLQGRELEETPCATARSPRERVQRGGPGGGGGLDLPDDEQQGRGRPGDRPDRWRNKAARLRDQGCETLHVRKRVILLCLSPSLLCLRSLSMSSASPSRCSLNFLVLSGFGPYIDRRD